MNSLLAAAETFSIECDGVHFDAHITDAGTVCIDACLTQLTEVIFPDEINQKPVTHLSANLCSKTPQLTAVVLPRYAQVIGDHAFDRCTKLTEIALGPALTTIGNFAFSNTKITEFDAPPTLEKLGAKAFFHCDKLVEVHLNEGCMSIGEGAFFGTRIACLHIPGSVVVLGREIFKQTPLADGRRFGSLTFGDNSPFVADERGGLYRRTSKGLVLLEMLSSTCIEYTLLPDTVRIADRAFLYHVALTRVQLNEGLEIIGNAAFKYCRHLRYVTVPESLRALGEEAFRSTMLQQFYFPEHFDFLGVLALSTCSYGNSLGHPTLRQLTIHPRNKNFYIESGLLCLRDEEYGDHAVIYLGPDTDVTIPKSVRYIDSFCFGGVDEIQHLKVHTDIIDVRLGAFFVKAAVPRVSIFSRDVDGNEQRYEAYFPSSSYGGQCFAQAFGGQERSRLVGEDALPRGKNPEGFVAKDTTIMDPATIFAFADMSIRHCYQTAERSGLILLRLRDGYFLDESSRDIFEKSVERHLEEFVTICSKQNTPNFIEMLVDLGFINETNIGDIINLLGELNDVRLVSYLLNVQHERFGKTQLVVEDL